jgi:hypothetical protein
LGHAQELQRLLTAGLPKDSRFTNRPAAEQNSGMAIAITSLNNIVVVIAHHEFIPNSEIKMAGMRHDVGAETFWKNRSIPSWVC